MVKDRQLSRRELFSLALKSLPALVPWNDLEGAGAKLLRPPGAVEAVAFFTTCRRCGKCREACPRQIIQLAGAETGTAVGTPYLVFTSGSCDFCLECIKACPSGALELNDLAPLGTAHLDRAACLAWNGTLCQECFYQCPRPGKALILEEGQRPVVAQEACNGCGSCEHGCLQKPAAIRVETKVNG